MSSIDRLHKFAELLCRALPELDSGSLSPRPLDDPTAGMHVGRLRTGKVEPGDMRVLFAVSDASPFVPMVLTTCEDTEVGTCLEGLVHWLGARPAPQVGGSLDLGEGLPRLAQMGMAGVVLLSPGMIPALAAFQDGIENGGERFEPRLVAFLDRGELAACVADFPALMRRFSESGRQVFLSASARG